MKQILTDRVLSIIIKLCLILYIIFITPNLSPTLLLLFTNKYFKLLILCLIFYISTYNPYISILISISFILSINTTNSMKNKLNNY